MEEQFRRAQRAKFLHKLLQFDLLPAPWSTESRVSTRCWVGVSEVVVARKKGLYVREGPQLTLLTCGARHCEGDGAIFA